MGSHSEEVLQPNGWSERFESGTLNTLAIAGLLAALSLFEKQVEEIVSRETLLTQMLVNELQAISGVTCYRIDE
ncbi:MAG: aminotransferase class V-fold PLP-dependent enzyme [Bacillota bacterium]|uniref:aminotransferase class V-fold PLP-dependent enzyme n=1 Tax=Virgibacillus TaxID=84406 RepID=UPI000EF55A62|nr:aminotransferase class V-fold PLP-dependent enzyme [Virgibacillus sp. M23]MDY7045580.1 aminotransferase class V-fold PLP-dependent enzyme [Virgibacillus sp. M23]